MVMVPVMSLTMVMVPVMSLTMVMVPVMSLTMVMVPWSIFVSLQNGQWLTSLDLQNTFTCGNIQPTDATYVSVMTALPFPSAAIQVC